MRDVLMHGSSRLFSWSMAGLFGILKSSVCPYDQSRTTVRFTKYVFFFFPEQAEEAANAARGAKCLVKISRHQHSI